MAAGVEVGLALVEDGGDAALAEGEEEGEAAQAAADDSDAGVGGCLGG